MSGKLSKERLKEMRHVGKSVRCSNMHGQFVAEELFDHIDLIESEKQSLTAENERLTRELHDSKTAATEEAAAHDEARKQLAECKQRLAALAVDPTNVDELADRVRTIYWDRPAGSWDKLTEHCKHKWRRIVREVSAVVRSSGEQFECRARIAGSAGGNDPQDCDWPFCGCDPKADKVLEAIEESGRFAEVADLQRQLAEARKWEGQYKRLYENCDASHEKTLKQLAEATNRLAELTKPADAIELRKIAWANYGAIYAQQKGEPLEPYESSTPERRARIEKAADAVAARVRAPLLEQIAELTAKLEAAEVKSRDDENELVGRQAIIIGLTEGVQAMQADRGRLAAELATTKQALAAMTDERDRARDMLRQAEASSEATQQSLAAARGEVERLRNPVAIAVSEAIDEGLALGPSPSPAKAAASEPVGLCPKCGIQPLTKEGDDMIRLGEKDYLCGNCKRYLCRPIESKAAASEPADSSHTPETAHTSSSQSGQADHSGEAGEKPEADPERRFVCPHCLSERLPRCYGQGEQMCATCGKVIHGAEVEAAKGESIYQELSDVVTATQNPKKMISELRQQLAAENQAREAAEKALAEIWGECCPDCGPQQYELFAGLLSKMIDEQRQRADAAEATVGAMQETIAWISRVAAPGSGVRDECERILAAAPGRAANERRAGKALAGKIRDALCSVEAIAHVERALADYDQALQGEQRGEGKHGN